VNNQITTSAKIQSIIQQRMIDMAFEKGNPLGKNMNGGVISLKAHMPKASRENLKLICGD
jgi:hypothetical protein